MRNINIGGSWMDEFYRIAEEKNWVIKKNAFNEADIEKFWGGLPDDSKNKIIPGWEGLSVSQLIDEMAGGKWGTIIQEWQKQNTSPKGEVSFNPSKVKVVSPEQPKATGMSPQLIGKIQVLISKATGMPVSDPKGKFLGAPDGEWGPLSAAAWNKYIEKYTTPDGPLVVDPVDESGRELPRIDDIRYVLSVPKLSPKADDMVSDAKDPYQDWASNMPRLSPEDTNIKVPTSENVLQKMHGKIPGQQREDIAVSPTDWRTRYRGIQGIPDDVTETEHLSTMRLLRQQGQVGPIKNRNQYMQALKQVREQRGMSAKQPQSFVPKVPEWATADDVTASVVNELTSLANDLDSLGEEEAAMLVDHQIKSYAAIVNKLYDITGETGEDLIGQAHPGGGPTLVPAKDEGGKVETIVEEHKKVVDKATKKPTGKYASTMAKLIATANKLEEEGEVEAAKIVDRTIEELRKSNPFVNRSADLEAAGSKDINASIKMAKEFDQKMELRTILANLTKILDKLEGEVKDQNPTVIYDNLGVNILEASVNKDKFDQVKTIYSLSGVQGPSSYLYDEGVEKLRRESESWRRQLTGWYENQNHAKWILSKLNGAEWSGNLKVIEKYYHDFPDDDVDGNWDQAFDLNFQSVKEALAKLSGAYDKAHGVAPKSVKPQESAQTSKPIQEKKPSNYQEQLKIQEEREIKEKTNNYIKTLDEFAKFVIVNRKIIETKMKSPGVVNKLIQWATNQKYNIINPKTKYPVAITDEHIKNINDYLNRLRTLAKSASVKMAQNPPAGVPNVPIPGVVKAPVKPGRTGPKIVSDPLVKRLQQALMSLYGDNAVGTSKDDGKWGKNTMRGWDRLVHDIPRANLSPATRDYNSLKPQFEKAIRFAARYAQKTKKQETKFKLNGKDYSIGDFESVTDFLAAIDRNYPGTNRNEMHDDEYIKVIQGHIREIGKAIMGEEGEDISDSYGPQILKLLQSYIIAIWKNVGNYILSQKGQKGLPGVPGEPGKSNAPGTPGTPGTPGGTEYQKRTDWAPGSQNAGLKGLFYPRPINTLDDIKLAVARLPSGIWLSTTDNFMTYANSALRQKGGPKLSGTYKGIAKQYWALLRNRVSNILTAITEKSGEIRATQPDLLRNLEEDIAHFNRALLAIGQQLGFVE